MADEKDKFSSGLVVGGLAGGLAGSILAALAAARPALAAPDNEKLDYISTLVQQLAAGQVAIAEAIESIPLGPDITARLDTIIESLDKELLYIPDKMCAVLWLNFPNLCYPIPTAFAITLAPGATITLEADVTPGFVEVVAGQSIATVDVDFIMSMVQLYDNGRLLVQDPAVTSISVEARQWVPVFTKWTLVLTNNSLLLNCTFHSWFLTYAIEARLFNYLKEKMRGLGLTIIPEEALK